MQEIVLNGSDLTVEQVVAVANGAKVRICETAMARVRRGRAVVDQIVESGVPAYGINTGVGSQKDYALSKEELARYNNQLVRGHATRPPGPLLWKDAVRGVMCVQANLFATGNSGVRPELLQHIVTRLNRDDIPDISAHGSVGASDLVPLAQLAVAYSHDLPLAAKEALSLMNSNSVTLGRGALALAEVRRLFRAYDLAACCSLEGFRGNLNAIAPFVNAVHRRKGQAESARHMRQLCEGSALAQPGQARFLQDPLSFRCASQIHGAGRAMLQSAQEGWNVELNSVTDNPVIDPDEGVAISHGNMDLTSLTLPIDGLRLAIAKTTDTAAERLHKLHWPSFSGLPTGLTESGSASGGAQFLNLSHIAASFLADVRQRARPVSLQTAGPLADGVEDTAAFGPLAVAEMAAQTELSWTVAAIEAGIACWAIKRRKVAREDLGKGVAALYDKLLPLLPIGREGEDIWDLAPAVDAFKEHVGSLYLHMDDHTLA